MHNVLINIFTQKQLKEAKSMLGKVSWLMSWFGIWPVEKTRFQRIKFKVYVIYVTLHLVMTVNNLVANFKNIKLITIILQQLMGLGMTFNRLLFINYSSNVSEIIKTTKEEIACVALTDITEKKIFVKIHKGALLYYTLTIKFMFFASSYFYLMPLYRFISAWFADEPLVLIPPYKIKVFFLNVSSLKRSFLLHIYELPALSIQLNFCFSVNMQVIIVMNLVAQMAILAEKITHLDLKEYSKASKVMIQKIVLRHMELIKLAKKIENTWTPIYCIELGFYMPLASLVIYNAMALFNNNQTLSAVPYYIYIIITMSSLFGHCFMGELVKIQSENLMDAYYNSNWYEMPIKYKKSIVICMTYTKIALNITAGKFFVYSLKAFTGMLKSIMAYVSLLREVIVMNTNVESKFEQTKYMFDKVRWIIEFLNVWPINPTKKKLIFFLVYLIHENVYLAMAYYDLFSIFGDLQLMTTNLIGTLVQMMMMMRLIFVKFSSRLKNIIIEIKEDVCDKNYQRTNEKIIYIKYSEMATNFYKITMGIGTGAGLSFYILPAQNYFIAWLLHQPAPLELPYRAKLFNTNETTLKQSIFLYIYQAPLLITALCYFATINMQFIIISNVCARIAILGGRINQINNSMATKTDSLIEDIVLKHLELIRLTKRVDETWTPVFLFEIIIFIPLLALVLFSAILALEASEIVAFLMLFTYIGAILSCLFAYCLMGELLLTEHENLLKRFYICNWEGMSRKSKKSWLICMVSGEKIPMRMTAGKIYIFSFNGFTGILRSSMAYVSLLRTLIA
ncbi:uncharacterized protein LOC141536021 [Cotesia typhae]|uniref:uncharacterized protein LOC141536021 n=1 Tax=Cotesia typhae TaxID=2053667 RepID=UPI003D685F85